MRGVLVEQHDLARLPAMSGSASSRYRGSAVFLLLENTSLRRDTSLTSLCLVTTQ